MIYLTLRTALGSTVSTSARIRWTAGSHERPFSTAATNASTAGNASTTENASRTWNASTDASCSSSSAGNTILFGCFLYLYRKVKLPLLYFSMEFQPARNRSSTQLIFSTKKSTCCKSCLQKLRDNSLN